MSADIISIGLLSEVLGLPVLEYRINGTSVDIIHYREVKQPSRWNIHELAHKCKEWAFKKGWAFKIEYLGIDDINITLISCRTEKEKYSKDFYNVVNCEDTFEPCQWILDNKCQ